MSLPEELISKFVQLTNDSKQTTDKSETTVYGEVVEDNGVNYVQLDGSDQLTPVTTTATITKGERVAVLIKNHTATVIGNITKPSARYSDIQDQVDTITELQIVVAKKVDTDDFVAEQARINTVVADNAVIRESLTVAEAELDTLQANYVEVDETLTANEADIENLKATKLDADVADAKYATIDNLSATDAEIYNLNATYSTFVETATKRLDAAEADIDNLDANKLSAEDADLKYATIIDLDTERARIDVLEADVADYTTKTEFNNLTVGGRNLVAGTDEIREYVGNINSSGASSTYKDVWTAKTIDIPTDTEYIVSFDAKADVAQNITCYFYSPNTTLTAVSSTGQSRSSAADGGCQVSITTEWTRYWVKWTQTPADSQKSIIIGRNFTENDIYIRAVKFEVGNTPTDWTPAPEDMATSDDVALVQSSSDLIEERVSTAESLIEQLSDSLAVLITDENGESLMTQTSDGWTFSTANIQDTVNATSENLDKLTNEVGDVNSTVNALQQAVDDLGVLNKYVKIGTYEDEPCIELDKNDSDFKLIITNTRIMFMEGSGVPAYINNQSLFIKKAVIEEELQQGEFIWKARSNGNLGLIWKGATS